MNQSHLVGVLQANRRAVDVVRGPQPGQWAGSLDQIVQVGAVDEFHHQEVQVAIFVDVVGTGNVRVVDRRHRAGLAVEPLECGLVLRLGHGQNLEGYPPLHQLVFAQEHLPHAANAEPFEHLVFADEEAFPTTLEQLLGLEVGQQSVAHHKLAQLDGVARIFTCRLNPIDVGLHPRFLEYAASGNQAVQFFVGRGHRHTEYSIRLCV